MSILRRSTPMVSSEAWTEMDKVAKATLQNELSGRKFVDFIGPKGWDYAAHPLGKLQVGDHQTGPVKYGINAVLPLIESRCTFELETWELDNITRGSRNPNLKALEDAARHIAHFEEHAIFHGFEPGCIVGLFESGTDHTVDLNGDDDLAVLKAIANALARLSSYSIEGPYVLLAEPWLWEILHVRSECYPLTQKLHNMGIVHIIRTSFEGGSCVLSKRGGDFELIIGQDISLGYQETIGSKSRFFFTESFTFHVINPEAVIPIRNAR